MTTDTPEPVRVPDLIEILRNSGDPELLPCWSRTVAMLVANKHRIGIAATDEEVAAAAPELFTALVKVCVEAKRMNNPRGEHRLAGLKWFLEACHAELHGYAELPTVN